MFITRRILGYHGGNFEEYGPTRFDTVQSDKPECIASAEPLPFARTKNNLVFSQGKTFFAAIHEALRITRDFIIHEGKKV